MVKRKSTCGLCKPTKKFKRNDTRLKANISRLLESGNLTTDAFKSWEKVRKWQ